MENVSLENVSLFQGAIRREESFSTVILDLSDVPYIDSTALGALVSAYVSRQKLGRRVVLSGASERVSKMLKITSIESLFLTFPTLEDAIGDLKRAGTALEGDDPDQPSFTRRRKSSASICTFLAMSGSWSFSNMISLDAISAASLGLKPRKPRITSPLARLMKLSGAR